MSEQDSNRSEDATPHKLEEARKKGSVAKSPDFTAMAVLAAMTACVYATAWDGFKQTMRLQLDILAQLGRMDWQVDAVSVLLSNVAMGMLYILAPLFLALAIAAVAANVAQTGPVFTMHPLVPDLTRISPVTGFKRIFSMRTIYESVKSIIKLIVLGFITWLVIVDLIPGLVGLTGLHPKAYARIMLDLAAGLMVKLLLALLAIALIDLVFSRWEFAKRMRMSKRDVTDEHKNREGDPRIRSRIRELRQEMLKRSKALGNVAEADVLITNPTHLAVALSYKHGANSAPHVIAKGAGAVALKMRQVARRHHIPIVENKLLARTLYREVAFDNYVPEKLYPQLAKIMVWVQAMRAARLRTAGVRA
ncbi:MAG TPA: EscU/YscU/HrcU family type III secretion system export apparatus switch protein [Telluria sp.]|jgi:flagellar biosynthetic protein FlhB